MNGAPHPAAEPQTPCCGNCPLLVGRDVEAKRGVCVRMPPAVVVVHEPKADIVSAQKGFEEIIKAVRPTMAFGEVCGEHPALRHALYSGAMSRPQ